jgi:hypothetical protein
MTSGGDGVDAFGSTSRVAVICTALDLEYRAVREHLAGPNGSLGKKVE